MFPSSSPWTRLPSSPPPPPQAVITAENHTIIGGLGSAVAEALAEAALRRPLAASASDTFAEGAKDAQYLFTKYGLTTQHL